MRTNFNFNNEFGTPKILTGKDFNKINITVHPIFAGIYLCFEELFKSLKTDFSVFSARPELHVWKDSNFTSYTVANNFQWYLYWSKTMPKNIKLLVHPFPQHVEKVELLKKEASTEFLGFLSSFHYQLNRLNPEKLLILINTYISTETLLNLNKENSYKPHRKMSLELLAKLLSYTRNQLNHRNKNINAQRADILDQLAQTSEIAQQLLNNSEFTLSPDRLWRS